MAEAARRAREVLAATRTRLGVEVRAAGEGDFARILCLARASFTQPEDLFTPPANTRHYRADFAADGRFGESRAIVCVTTRGTLAAACYYQLRCRGEIYVRELAAMPPAGEAKLARAGALLLAHALCDGGSALRLATLRVLAEHRVHVPPGPNRAGWRDPAAYYERLGFAACAEGGRDSHGKPGRPGDLWMAGRVAVILPRLLDFVDARTRAGTAASGS